MATTENWLPDYLQVEQRYHIVICSIHKSAYTMADIDRHLRDRHKIKIGIRNRILQQLDRLDIADSMEDVPRPPDGSLPVPGLPVRTAFQCTKLPCRRISINRLVAARHFQEEHEDSSSRPGLRRVVSSRVNERYTHVRAQTLFIFKVFLDYFTVVSTVEEPTRIVLRQRGWDDMERNYQDMRRAYAERYNHVQPVEHISELTKWLRMTGFHTHLQGLATADMPRSYAIPSAELVPDLGAICDSVARVLNNGMNMLSSNDVLSPTLGRALRRAIYATSATGNIDGLVNPLHKATQRKYIQTIQKIFCYIFRCHGDQPEVFVGQRMFIMNEEQEQLWDHIKITAAALCSGMGDSSDSEESVGNGMDNRLVMTEAALDDLVLRFSMALIAHDVGKRTVDSPILSWVIVAAWDAKKNTWMKIGNYTGYLSHIIYCSRILLLWYSAEEERRTSRDLTEILIEFRNKWMVETSPGPFAEILGVRTLGMKIASTIVEDAQVFWDNEEETITYQDIAISLDAIRSLAFDSLAKARAIFEKDLCFEIDNIPTFDLMQINDNISNRTPGECFLTDPRNQHLFQDARELLIRRTRKDIRLSNAFVRERPSDQKLELIADRVVAYEKAVQQFLKYLVVAVHVGSGQPGRAPEITGMRWENNHSDIRNIFVHNGDVIFVLSYHKNLISTNAARYPARALMPKVGMLLVRYLAVVLPFRNWLISCSGIGTWVSPYLWSTSTKVWPEGRMGSEFESTSRELIGIKLGIRAYRQIAIGIAIRKLAGCGLKDRMAEAGGIDEEAEDEESEASLLAVFHHQAAHAPRTGNRAYGNPIDYLGGLTSAALTEYVLASKIWHTFIAGGTYDKLTKKHARSQSSALAEPLAKRLAYYGLHDRYRHSWSMTEARTALQALYPGAKYKSEAQELAIQTVVSNTSPVIAILGTGAGKSLLYMLLPKLAGIGVTILLVPLLALKQDTIRRCDEYGVPHQVWGTPSFSSPLGGTLVIASLDQAVGIYSMSFRSYIARLSSLDALHAIVVDECHLAITSDQYRSKMRQVAELRAFRCQSIFLTATLPPSMEKDLCSRFGLASPVYQRAKTTLRYNIEYSVEVPRHPRKSIDRPSAAMTEMLKGAMMESEDARAIIYCRTKANVEAVAKELNYLAYHADIGPDSEKAERLRQWTDGEHPIIVATTAFTEGVDYPHVRLVFYLGAPDSAIEFVQGSGRGGRDGKLCRCRILQLSDRPPRERDVDGELLDLDTAVMEHFLNRPRCRLLPLGLYLDGIPQFCANNGSRCDMCKHHGVCRASEQNNAVETFLAESRMGGGPLTQHGETLDEGPRQVREQIMSIEQERIEFRHYLDILHGKCVPCIIYGQYAREPHSLEKCSGKQKFFDMKKWFKMAPFSGCYHCGLPQDICDTVPGSKVKNCQYRDIIVPFCWALYIDTKWRRLVERVAGRKFKGESEYMRWAGSKCTVWGKEASNLIFIGRRFMGMVVQYLKDGTKGGVA